MPTNSGRDSQAEATTEDIVFALRRDPLPNPYLRKARAASRPSSPRTRTDAERGESTASPQDTAAAEEKGGGATDERHIASRHVVDAAHPEPSAGDEGKGARVVALPPIRDDLPLHLRPAVAMEMGQKACVKTG